MKYLDSALPYNKNKQLMKKIITTLLLFLSMFAFAQESAMADLKPALRSLPTSKCSCKLLFCYGKVKEELESEHSSYFQV